MKKKFLILFAAVSIFGLGQSALTSPDLSQVVAKVKTVIKYDHSDEQKAKEVEKDNQKTENKIRSLDKKIAALRKELKKLSGKSVESVSKAALASLSYQGKDIISVNNNDPEFSQSDLSTSRGPWQEYGNLDGLNRVTSANALLNERLMPKAKREALTIDPTGWHNKRISGGWLYNRCHLIGYQLTGQNNNWKNLMTGTRQLNDPDMLRYEDEVAEYLRESPSHYVRYRITPIFRGNELLARGIEMEGQSTGSNAVHFNVYIFNVEQGVKLDYADGTSRIG